METIFLCYYLILTSYPQLQQGYNATYVNTSDINHFDKKETNRQITFLVLFYFLTFKFSLTVFVWFTI